MLPSVVRRRRVTTRAAASGVVAAVCAALVAGAAPAAAQAGSAAGLPDLPGVDPELIEAVRHPFEPAPDTSPERYLPSPTPDPWYSDPPALDPATPNGAILATRDAHIPWFNSIGVGRTWQMLVQTRDSHDRPVAVPSTVVEPVLPWRGPGPRPIVSFAVAIDGLGNTCQPSWAMTQKLNIQFPPILQVLVARGYAVVVTDFQGPKGAYGAMRLNGHAVLDGIRAARAFAPAGLQDSPAAVFGYSGGGIAASGAAQLQATYAPEMSEYLVGIGAGGAPLDLAEALENLDGTVGAGLMRAAVFGIAREYPEMYGLLNRTGDVVAREMRDWCAEVNTPAGIVTAPLGLLTTTPDPVSDPRVRRMIEENSIGRRPDEVPGVPVAIFSADREHFPGIGDQFFPEARAEELRSRWCAAGANVDYLGVAGEHVTGMFTAPRPVLDWIDRRFDEYEAGRPPPDFCR